MLFYLLVYFSVNAFAATDVHGVMCGGEIREADMTVINKYMADNPDVNITMEAVPWGTCQDKVINLAIAGDPVSFSYIGSRTLKGLAENGHIVPVNIPEVYDFNVSTWNFGYCYTSRPTVGFSLTLFQLRHYS